MLLTFVIAYMLGSVAIGLWAARGAKKSSDFAVAGRRLPFSVTLATVFATWFGAESIFGVSSRFVEGGLNPIASDPFGATLCLLLAAWLFSKTLYRMNCLTLGDYLRLRYGKVVELLVTLCIVASYIGWVAAQVKALGILFSSLSGGAISDEAGMMAGAAAVLIYTLAGGMLSVAVLDFAQMIVMILGLGYIAVLIGGQSDGGVSGVIAHASETGKLDFFPKEASLEVWLAFAGSFFTMAFGSLPQQDVYQRITSAKSAKVAFWGSAAGALLYFAYSFVPAFIAYAGSLSFPELLAPLAKTPEKIIPAIVMAKTGLLAQALFYGAVLSAIMSTASATLLAPSVAFSENIVEPFFPGMSDRSLLLCMRISCAALAVGVLLIAMFSSASLYEMVGNAYKITFAAAFAPLVGGLLWKGAKNCGAMASAVGGAGVWIAMELAAPEFPMPPQMVGFFASWALLFLGSFAEGALRKRSHPGGTQGGSGF